MVRIDRRRGIGFATLIAVTVGAAIYGLTRSSSLCRTSEPASWRTAARAQPLHTWRLATDTSNVAALHDGTLVIDEKLAGTDALVRVTPSGATRTLFTLPTGQEVDDLDAFDRYAMLTYFPHDALTRHDIRFTATIAIDVRDGTRITIAGPGASVTGLPTRFNDRDHNSFGVDAADRVWYATGRGPRPTMYRYDLATGRRTTIGTAPAGRTRRPAVQVTPDGVYWDYAVSGHPETADLLVRAARLPLPAPVAAHEHSAPDLTTDGRAYAWTNASILSWWQPGMRRPRTVDLNDADNQTAGVDTVAGPIISAYSGDEANDKTVIDMRTGAYVIDPKISQGANTVTTPSRTYLSIYHAQPAATIYAVPTPLPELHC